MKHRTLFLITLALLLGSIACSVSGAQPPPLPTTAGDAGTPVRTPVGGETTPSPTPRSTVTPLPSITSAGATGAPGTSVPTTRPANTAAPLATATRPAATATRPAASATSAGATATWVGQDEVLIFLIAMEDNGASGPLVGCGDSAVGVTRQIPATRGVLRAALNELLSLHDQYYGQSGLYNALYQSNLTLDDVTIINGTAKIVLSGALQSGGVCDDPRIIAQIEYTARQFSTVQAVEITVNGTDIRELLSGR